MNVLLIKYIRGKAPLRRTDDLSVSIDGESVGKIQDQEELSLELTEGSHEVIVRCGHCKKVIELHMEKDDSFTVSWDYVTGGLMVCDGPVGFFTTEDRRNYWLLFVLFTAMAINTAVLWMRYFGLVPGDLFISLELVCMAILIISLIPLYNIRGRKVVWKR